MRLATILVLLVSSLATARLFAQPYNFTPADELLVAALDDFDGNVAVIVRQNGVELYRFQAGAIDYDTQNRLASFTKTISAGVILSLADDGLLSLDERLGDTYPLFESNGLGDATILDCWAMRHGIDSAIAYERDARFTLAESITRIGLLGYLNHPPREQLGYDGSGMQATGGIAQLRTGQAWSAIAHARIFDRCDMPQADYLQFDPNPAVAGGLRSTAEETMNYAQMILDGGIYNGEQVLSRASIDVFFTNFTRDLPVFASPWPPAQPDYPYGVDPDYAFGGWVLAENPATRHVEEIVGAGAWGSYIWIDRRRALTAVVITDIQPQTQTSMGPALALFALAREITEDHQVRGLRFAPVGERMQLSWQPPPGAVAARIYGSAEPIRDIYDLRAADDLGQTFAPTALVPRYPYYAVTAVFPMAPRAAGSRAAQLGAQPQDDAVRPPGRSVLFENTALIPSGNATTVRPPR